MTTYGPRKYIENGDMSAASITGKALAMLGMNRQSFQCEWPATSTPVGKITIEVSDDPRVEEDLLRGTSTARWTKVTIPAGSYHGTDFTVSGTDITTAGAGGTLELNLERPCAFMRLKYTKTSGGAASTFQATASANS